MDWVSHNWPPFNNAVKSSLQENKDSTVMQTGRQAEWTQETLVLDNARDERCSGLLKSDFGRVLKWSTKVVTSTTSTGRMWQSARNNSCGVSREILQCMWGSVIPVYCVAWKWLQCGAVGNWWHCSCPTYVPTRSRHGLCWLMARHHCNRTVQPWHQLQSLLCICVMYVCTLCRAEGDKQWNGTLLTCHSPACGWGRGRGGGRELWLMRQFGVSTIS